jgi:hypothetical protein
VATVSRRERGRALTDQGVASSFRGHRCSAKTAAFSPDDEPRSAGITMARSRCGAPTGVARVERIADASISQVAFSGRELLVSTWDAHGTLSFVDPREGVVARVSVAA